MDKYVDYAVKQAEALLNIDSPSGYTTKVTQYLLDELTSLGYEPYRSVKGGVVVSLGGKDKEDGLFLEAHVDTLGAMVAEIKSDGRLRVTNIGGMNANNAEAENVRVHTRDNKIVEGTCQLINPSVHVNGDYDKTDRKWSTVEIVLDEPVESKENVDNLGIQVGDFVCFEPRFRVTESGYIKSRFLDDKLSAAALLAYAKYLADNSITPERAVYLHFTVFEEVGHGGAASVPEGVTEAISVDMGCVGEGLTCTEREVSICVKDSGGPYHYDVVGGLIDAAKQSGAHYALDVYPYYGSDVECTLGAGHDIKHGLIGPGVFASHGYERSHKRAVESTLKVIATYVK